MHRLESMQMAELLRKLSPTHSLKPGLSVAEEAPSRISQDFLGNSARTSQASDSRPVSKKNIVFLDEKDGGATAGDASTFRLLCHTPSFASRGGQDFDELVGMKQRISDIEAICGQ